MAVTPPPISHRTPHALRRSGGAPTHTRFRSRAAPSKPWGTRGIPESLDYGTRYRSPGARGGFERNTPSGTSIGGAREKDQNRGQNGFSLGAPPTAIAPSCQWQLVECSVRIEPFRDVPRGSGGLRFPMTSKALTWEDRLLVSKFEALQPDPSADDPALLVFQFTIEETDSMVWFWKDGLIEPTGVATAQFTRIGLEKVRKLRAQIGKLAMAASQPKLHSAPLLPPDARTRI